jgi:hypothetical protein
MSVYDVQCCHWQPRVVTAPASMDGQYRPSLATEWATADSGAAVTYHYITLHAPLNQEW